MGGSVECPACKGLKRIGCPECGGSGGSRDAAGGMRETWSSCSRCDGKGLCTCPICLGQGVMAVVPF